MKINLNNISDTIQFGKKLGRLLEAGDIICLNGDLGAGKTTLSKSIGEGLEISDYITSPTFALINEYEGRLQLYHFDVYRLNSYEELEELGAEDYFYGEGVCLIEWAEKISEDLPENRLEIWINRAESEDARVLEILAFGERCKTLLEELG